MAGSANERSDWDISIDFKESVKQIARWPEFELEAELSRAVGATLQVIVLNPPFTSQIYSPFPISTHSEIRQDKRFPAPSLMDDGSRGIDHSLPQVGLRRAKAMVF